VNICGWVVVIWLHYEEIYSAMFYM